MGEGIKGIGEDTRKISKLKRQEETMVSGVLACEILAVNG